jgi:hypothetical protein
VAGQPNPTTPRRMPGSRTHPLGPAVDPLTGSTDRDAAALAGEHDPWPDRGRVRPGAAEDRSGPVGHPRPAPTGRRAATDLPGRPATDTPAGGRAGRTPLSITFLGPLVKGDPGQGVFCGSNGVDPGHG